MEELNEIVKNILKFPARKIIDEKLVEYRISILQPDLRALNADFAVENDGIRHGLKFIKYISEDSVNVMQENFTQDELIDFDKVIDKKYTNNGRQKFIIDKKVATALIYSGALDYLNIKRTELVKIYNQKRSSDIEIIEDDIKLIETEEFYNGYSIKAIEQYSSVRTLIQQRFPDVMNLTDLIQSEYSLGQAIDYVYINSIKLKKTAKGKTFRTISAANIEDTYYPIFIWDKDVDAVAGQKYIAEFAKSDNFIRILRTVRY
jgi:DNA polymerase III alpha subunit